MNITVKSVILSLCFTITMDAVDWQTLGVVSVASSYLGCAYFKKKEPLHSPQFWCDVASGAGISFLIGQCFDRWLVAQVQNASKVSTSSLLPGGHGGDSVPAGLLSCSQVTNNTICGVRVELLQIFASILTPVMTTLLVAWLQKNWQRELQQEQQGAMQAQQRQAHRFQEEMSGQQHIFQTRERLASEQFMAEEHEKNRAHQTELHVKAEQERSAKEQKKKMEEQIKNAANDALFMEQFKTNGVSLPDRTDVGYTPAPLQELLSALDTDTFIAHHLLLSGYAGSGKSHSIKIIAHEMQKRYEVAGKQVEIFTVHQGALCSRYMGETLSNLERFFRCIEERAAEGVEVVIMWDEIDVLTRRSSSDDSAAQDINYTVGGLKEIIERLPKNVHIFASTNHPDTINAAIKSRFDGHCELKLPTEAEREKALRFWAKHDCHITGGLWKKYAKKTHGWSMRDLKQLIKSAQKYSNGCFDKWSLNKAFEKGVHAKKVDKKDFSTYETGWDKTKRYAGVAKEFSLSMLHGIASTLGGGLISLFMR